jgi:two-component system, OmpR family, response regulator
MTSASQPLHIVLVEDDSELAQWVREFLEQQSFRVSIAERGDDAVDMIRDVNPDLVLLDIMLPGMDGHQVCREVRKFYHHPILILTANDGELDEVLGLELGADDFIPKPVRPRVLLARIKALLRRDTTAPQKQQQQLSFGIFAIDYLAKSVTLQGQSVQLSSTEFDLLWVLASHAGEVMHRNDLVQLLRGFDYDGFDRTIDVRISRLRKKLGDTSQEPERIKTIWGKGYLFVPNAWI